MGKFKMLNKIKEQIESANLLLPSQNLSMFGIAKHAITMKRGPLKKFQMKKEQFYSSSRNAKKQN